MAETDSHKDLSGPEIIAKYVRNLPDKPGVYRMMDERGNVLYVGKAKSLKNRVTSYTRYQGHTIRIQRMINATKTMEFVVVESETEALLLEASLIKRLKPRYNILLRDDKSFPYILLRQDHEATQLKKHRGARNIKGEYFGPFASAGAVNRTLDTLQRAFRLRTCTDGTYENRTRPCMLHQIKRCAAPCTGEVSLAEYNGLVDDAANFLRGKSSELRSRMTAEMQAASEALEFEKAADIRDRLRAMARVTGTDAALNPTTFEDGDVAAIHMMGGQTCVQVFFFRSGLNWGNRAYFPRHEKDADPADVLEAFLAQFYNDKPLPKFVFVNQDLPNRELLENALAEKSGIAVKVQRPRRGEKYDFIRMAQRNAHESLIRKLAETASQGKLLSQFAEEFGLEEPPQRIEVYDNSHIQGTNAIGAFIVAGPDGFEKNQYRTYNIKGEDLTPGDDFGMMREVMTRRFSRLMKDEGGVWPDVVLIDGGKGQLSAVIEALDAIGATERVTLISIAKGPDRNAGRETFYMPGREPFTLPQRSAVMYFLQRLRDEAHRFAIGTHRARRKKQMKTNPLDGIPGVGPTRKKALLAHFGSAKGVSEARVSDLEQVEGVSSTLAKTIYDFFHE